MSYNSLRSFAKWWYKETPVNIPSTCVKLWPRYDAIKAVEFVLFREDYYQVELITLLPGARITAHCHPNVESYEIHYSGGGTAWMNKPDNIIPDIRLDKSPLTRKLYISAHTWHGGMSTVRQATTAISIQRWLNWHDPTFITDDWQTMI